MTELALFVDMLPKKGNLSLKQHKNSCQWYDWKSKSVEISDNSKSQPPNTFIKRLAGLERCKTNLGDDAIVPPGEATTKNKFCFSQHDNRNRIKAPEKKTVLLQDRQSQSQNISNTLDWTRNIKDGEYKITKTSNDRKIYKCDMNIPVVGRPSASFRRFPKKHHEGNGVVGGGMHGLRRSRSNLLSQEGLLGQEPVRTSLRILAQPQSYIGFQAVSKPKAPQRTKTYPGWCYSYHGKTYSKRVSNNTQHACYRF